MGNMYSGVKTRYTVMCSPIMKEQWPGYTRQGNTIGVDMCQQHILYSMASKIVKYLAEMLLAVLYFRLTASTTVRKEIHASSTFRY